MKTLHLYGALREKYGESFELDVSTPAEAVRAIARQIPEFEREVREGTWHVLRGKLEDEDDIGESEIEMTLGVQNEVHLLPAVQGANNGILQTIVGVVLVVVGVVFENPALIGMGVGMVVGGIVQMMTKLPGLTSDQSQDGVDQRASFLFNGATNTSSQGVAVPRGYGRLIVGSIVVSAALYAEEMAA